MCVIGHDRLALVDRPAGEPRAERRVVAEDQLGEPVAGDDRAALGLAGVAIKAGARSALASLWFVNDQSSTLLVTEFYRHLRQPGVTKARALQQAQLKMIGDNRFSHPGYWAPYLLIGNWL